MKRCPRCGQTYKDEAINFCLNDGELLSYLSDDFPATIFSSDIPSNFADDSPPTVVMNRPRVTNLSNWEKGNVPDKWQSGPPVIANQPYGMSAFTPSRDQTLPTISLVLGIISCILICCYGGIWLGLPAAIIGYLGMRNTDTDPQTYAGRGMAITGMVLGIITFVAAIFFVIASTLAG